MESITLKGEVLYIVSLSTFYVKRAEILAHLRRGGYVVVKDKGVHVGTFYPPFVEINLPKCDQLSPDRLPIAATTPTQSTPTQSTPTQSTPKPAVTHTQSVPKSTVAEHHIIEGNGITDLFHPNFDGFGDEAIIPMMRRSRMIDMLKEEKDALRDVNGRFPEDYILSRIAQEVKKRT